MYNKPVNKNLIFEIFERARDFHNQKSSEWNLIREMIKPQFNDVYNNFQEVIALYTSILKDLKFTVNFTTTKLTTDNVNLSELEQSQQISEETEEILRENDLSLRTAIEDGIAYNYGIIQIFVSENQVRIKRKDPRNVAIYRLPNKKFFLCLLKERIIWTDNYIYKLSKDEKEAKHKKNPLGFIPYCIFQATRIEEDTETPQSLYGHSWISLYNIQKRYETNQDYARDLTHSVIKPPIIQKFTERKLTKQEIDVLYKGNGVVQVQDLQGFILQQSKAENGLIILNRNEEKIIQDKQALTSITPLTTGSLTKNLAPTFFKDTLEVSTRTMKQYESEYILFYNELVKKIAKLKTYTMPEIYTINIDKLKLKTQQKTLSPDEKLRFMQETILYINNLGQTPEVLELSKTLLIPQFAEVMNSITENPVQNMIALVKAFNSIIEQRKTVLEMQQQTELIENQNNNT